MGGQRSLVERPVKAEEAMMDDGQVMRECRFCGQTFTPEEDEKFCKPRCTRKHNARTKRILCANRMA
jgi:predicted nucleic acid-binding Zn ribbon protein